MRINASSYGFYVTPDDVASGPLDVTPSAFTFGTSNTCVGAGRYAWTLRHRVLRFSPLGADPCPRGSFLAASPWHRRSR